MSNCNIKFLGKFRNGSAKYWCSAHFSFAKSAAEESPPTECAKHDTPVLSEKDKYVLDPAEWDGGVALWGALESVYNTTRFSEPSGIHLHARLEEGGEKQIDYTFKVIDVKSPENDLFGSTFVTLNTEIANAYTASMVFGKELKCIKCPSCQKPHIDSDFFAVTYHRKHMCTYCGKEFIDDERGISNPVIEIQRIFNSATDQRTIKIVDLVLDIKQEDYPGGIEIWGSNPAIIWTPKRQEESGIHVHVFSDKEGGQPFADETFGKVIIDGINLNGTEVRFLMVQQSLTHLKGRVLSLYCPKCGLAHCDRGDSGIRPHEHHQCEFCSEEFPSAIKCVSNPIVDKLNQLRANYERLQK